jgi:hypothetical protein
MFWTNVFLALAFVAMIAGFVWLFRDGEGPAPQPGIMRKSGNKSAESSSEDSAVDSTDKRNG